MGRVSRYHRSSRSLLLPRRRVRRSSLLQESRDKMGVDCVWCWPRYWICVHRLFSCLRCIIVFFSFRRFGSSHQYRDFFSVFCISGRGRVRERGILRMNPNIDDGYLLQELLLYTGF